MTAAGPAEPPLQAWADALEAAAAGTSFDRVRVLAETASTQDAAARLAGYPHRPGGPWRQDHVNLEPATQEPSDHEVRKPHVPSDLIATSAPLRAASPRDGGGTQASLRDGGGTWPRPGLIVVAGRQTAGRGRHGRKWADTAGLGLAMTFVVDGGFNDTTLAMAGGVAALRAAEAALGAAGRLGLKWPNDVVERPPDGVDARPPATSPGRKLAGVLVERRGAAALLGIGVNVRQKEGDWPPELAAGRRCVSLQMLGSQATRLEVARLLVARLDEALGLADAELGDVWEERRVA